MKIKDISKCATKIKNIGPCAEKIDPKELAKALGAEEVGQFKVSSGPLGAIQAYDMYKLMQEDRYYLEFSQACAKIIKDKNCTKYFKKFDQKELPRVSKIIGMLKNINPSTILDVGTGRGRLLWPVAYNFPQTKITCIDVCEWRIEIINAVHDGGVDRINGIIGDVTNNNFLDNSFDVVIASEVIEHITDPQRAVSEMLRITNKFFIATVPSKPDNNPDHIHYFTSDDFQKLIDNSGYNVSKIVFEYVQNSMTILVIKVQ